MNQKQYLECKIDKNQSNLTKDEIKNKLENYFFASVLKKAAKRL